MIHKTGQYYCSLNQSSKNTVRKRTSTFRHNDRFPPAGCQCLGHLPLITCGALATPHICHLGRHHHEAIIGVKTACTQINLKAWRREWERMSERVCVSGRKRYGLWGSVSELVSVNEGVWEEGLIYYVVSLIILHSINKAAAVTVIIIIPQQLWCCCCSYLWPAACMMICGLGHVPQNLRYGERERGRRGDNRLFFIKTVKMYRHHLDMNQV